MSIGNRAGQRACVAGCVIGYWSVRAVMIVGAVIIDVDGGLMSVKIWNLKPMG